MRRVAIAVIATLAAGAVAMAFLGPRIWGAVEDSEPVAQPAPLGVKKYIVIMADGILKDPTLLASHDPVLAERFQRQIGRSPAEVQAKKAEAVAFYKERYGLDFSGGDVIPGATLQTFVVSDEAGYRTYTVSGEVVPPSGWAVLDGGWGVIIGSGGLRLHGGWGGVEGKVVPEGTGIPFGDYAVVREAADGSKRTPLVISYRAVAPILPPVPGTTPDFDCDLMSEEFGPGRGLGVFEIAPRPDGTAHFLERNVLVFQ